jgi:HK97 family phage major capsid protein
VNLKEIETRMSEIKLEISDEKIADERINELTEEVEKLKEERASIQKGLEQRQKLIDDTLAGVGEVIEERKEESQVEVKLEVREIAALPEYRTGWLKKQMGVPLNEAEARSVASANAASVIPVFTADKIWALVKQKANLLNEIDLYRVNGAVNVPVEGTNTAAALHTENGAMDAAPDTWTNVQLSAFEIVKFVRFSKTLMNMAVDMFEAKLAEKISDKIVEKIESYILYGTGSSQPKGIQYAQTWSDGSNGVDWASSAPTAAEVIELVSYFPGGHYSNAKWIMNHKTFFQFIYALRDDAKYPLVKEVGAGQFTVLGRPVLFSDAAADGEYFLADLKQVVGNLSEDILVERSDASGFAYNAIDFRGSCIFDCDIAVPTAFVKSEATLA